LVSVEGVILDDEFVATQFKSLTRRAKVFGLPDEGRTLELFRLT
jgi:hypothetical protein